jgi:DNA-binding NarL/FixJ family response regulator
MDHQLIIYEDNTRLRQSLELLLNDGNNFSVAGAFENCDDAVQQAGELNAAIILMDIDMPGIGGIEGVKKIKAIYPDIKIVMHTVFDDDNRIFDSICAGADGYMLKNTSPSKLLQSLLDVMNGDAPMSPFVAQKVFQHFRSKALPETDLFNLSAREKTILQLLVQGNSYKMIADKAGIATDTVGKHLHKIYGKLQVSCGTEAVAKAIRHKIVSLV